MLKVKFALLCDQAFLDQAGKLNIIGEFDRLFTTNDKAVLSRGFLVSRLTDDPNKESEIEISITHSESNDSVLKTILKLKTDQKGTAGLLFEIVGLMFKNFGPYKIRISSGDDVLTELDLDVQKVSNKVART